MATRPALELDGLATLRDTLTGFAPAEADKIAGDAVHAVAKSVENAIFQRLRSYSRSGQLAFSLTVVRKREKLGLLESQVRGGGTAPYLLMREFGTSQMKAAPAIVPATEEIRPDLPAMMKGQFADKLAEALAKRARGRR